MGVQKLLDLVVGQASGVGDDVAQSQDGLFRPIRAAAQGREPAVLDKPGQFSDEALPFALLPGQVLASDPEQVFPSPESRALDLLGQGLSDLFRKLAFILSKQVAQGDDGEEAGDEFSGIAKAIEGNIGVSLKDELSRNEGQRRGQ